MYNTTKTQTFQEPRVLKPKRKAPLVSFEAHQHCSRCSFEHKKTPAAQRLQRWISISIPLSPLPKDKIGGRYVFFQQEMSCFPSYKKMPSAYHTPSSNLGSEKVFLVVCKLLTSCRQVPLINQKIGSSLFRRHRCLITLFRFKGCLPQLLTKSPNKKADTACVR